MGGWRDDHHIWQKLRLGGGKAWVGQHAGHVISRKNIERAVEEVRNRTMDRCSEVVSTRSILVTARCVVWSAYAV